MMKTYRRMVLSLVGNLIFHHLHLTTFSEKQTPHTASKHPHVYQDKTAAEHGRKGVRTHKSSYPPSESKHVRGVQPHIEETCLSVKKQVNIAFS